jgi:hypothetical protein
MGEKVMSEEQAEYATPDVGSTTDIVRYGAARLELDHVPTWDEAVEVTKRLDVIGRNAPWWIGDWLNYTESIFHETWTQLIPDIGWDEKTLKNWKWVAENVRPNGRYENLSWSHHEKIAKLPPEMQDLWLERAATGGWTVKRLMDELKGPQQEKEPKPKVTRCPECTRWMVEGQECWGCSYDRLYEQFEAQQTAQKETAGDDWK